MAKSGSVEIKKIVVKLGSKEMSLSLDEAKELQDILNKTFGAKETVYIPSQPVVIDRPWYPPYRWWEVTWDNKTSVMYCANRQEIERPR